ncbi:hypothetical protein HYS31_00525 [Candidatus Woesearchaeota archaeon]|nr:hypothetical protein [Candidatus Woesearchaeota archaeon]
MKRKSQSISINTIIIAAIGLAVLVVLFAIFTGRLGGFTRGVQETDTCAQKCSSLDMVPGVHPSSDATKECSQGQYIAGVYTDGKYGCCCVPKA